LIRVQDKEGCWTGHTFGHRDGHRDGSVSSMAEYDNKLRLFLRQIQEAQSELIAPSDDIESNYSFPRTFRRMDE
jgi:hypothetical protein